MLISMMNLISLNRTIIERKQHQQLSVIMICQLGSEHCERKSLFFVQTAVRADQIVDVIDTFEHRNNEN